MKLIWPTIYHGLIQAFGENNVPFYAQLGLLGHNGIDLIARHGENVYSASDGVLTGFKESNGFANVRCEATDGSYSYDIIYGHLDTVLVPIRSTVKAGQLIAKADNRGQYTTGDHLHFAVYPRPKDANNGYGGAIDPLPFMVPYGFLAKVAGDSTVWQIKDGLKHRLEDKLSLFMIGASGYSVVIEVEQSELDRIPIGLPIIYNFNDVKLNPEQLKDFFRTFVEAPQEAINLAEKHFNLIFNQ